ncbi:MAG: L,D-transpeptidase family protein [Pseudomonadota bacterium]|nr:L,D-transpeptidase family protein [Pseudomonadota bacterium]
MTYFLLQLILVAFPLNVDAAAYYYNSESDLIGNLQYHTIKRGDTWESIGYYYDVGYNELRSANQHISRLSRHVGDELIIPTLFLLPTKAKREGIVVNLAEKRLYFFPKDESVVYTYPVSIGKSGWRTPQFKGFIYRKKIAPTWNVPKSIKQYYLTRYRKVLPDTVSPGPDNPLGNYALYTSQRGILIHGTNNEKLIGRDVSSGCVRMYNRNIQELFYLVSTRESVHFIHEDEKFGLHQGDLFFEKHLAYYPNDPDDIMHELDKIAAENEQIRIDIDRIMEHHEKDTGVPIEVGSVQ